MAWVVVGNVASSPDGTAVVRSRVSVYCVVERLESGQLGPRLCGQPMPVCTISVESTTVSRSSLLPKRSRSESRTGHRCRFCFTGAHPCHRSIPYRCEGFSDWPVCDVVDHDGSSGNSAQCDGILLRHGQFAGCIIRRSSDVGHDLRNICENGNLHTSCEINRVDTETCVCANAKDRGKGGTIDTHGDRKKLKLSSITIGKVLMKLFRITLLRTYTTMSEVSFPNKSIVNDTPSSSLR